MYKPKHFIIQELVCPDVYHTFYPVFGEGLWAWIDHRLLETDDFIREKLGPTYINNWDMDDKKRIARGLQHFDERGLRCLFCDEVQKAIKDKKLYFSSHMRGQGNDLNVAGMTSDQVKEWLLKHADELPYPIRIEDNTIGWTHIDTCISGNEKVKLF